MTATASLAASTPAGQPVGIFDSGIGGLSVVRHIRAQLPQENLLYFADSGFAPYGDKTDKFVIERSLAIADFLLAAGCKALVIACNTATASAVHLLRERYPQLPIVGIEPGLKPAAAVTRTRTVGVMATDRTLSSPKFQLLHQQLTLSTGVRFVTQACSGLADLIEEGELESEKTVALVQRYVSALVAERADTLVLGCTHYPFVQSVIESAARKAGADSIHVVDTGIAVARQLTRLLDHNGIRRDEAEGTLEAFTSGDAAALSRRFDRQLHISSPVREIV
jgi:glutamate racemase